MATTISSDALFRWANKKIEASGRTTFPTFRQAAKRFGCSYDAIIEAVEDADYHTLQAEYFGYNVGMQAGGLGGACGEYECRGDYTIEAWKTESPFKSIIPLTIKRDDER